MFIVDRSIMKLWRPVLMAVLLIISMFELVGCETLETSNDAAGTASKPTERNVSKGSTCNATAKSSAAASVEKTPDYTTINPVPIIFDKLSVKLDDNDKCILAQISDRAKKADKLVVIGYCDRNQIGNASAAAIARARVVRDELVDLGVPAKNIKIKHVTTVSNKHAVDIEF